MKKKVRILVVGGGPAGLAAAAAAEAAGVKSEDILIAERDGELGGILNQCIHNGFGLHTFQEELTGPEYAERYARKVRQARIPYMLQTMVVDIREGERDDNGVGKIKYVTAMNKTDGLFTVEAQAVILAMGCRERPRGALNIPGYRPAGIYSAGMAQRYVNIEGRMPGKEAVILGSGDIGLIMARRMTLEGAKVKLVAELMPYSGGLKRNIVQCLEDFGIPLKLSHTVVGIHGKERLEGVTIAEVDGNRKPIAGTEEYVSCDTLLLSCGLIPENELSAGLGVELSPVTSGPVVNESLETNVEGVFACGNVLHVHDLVDYVSEEAENAGRNAAEYVLGAKERETVSAAIGIRPGLGVRYTVPSLLRPGHMQEEQVIRFRVGDVYRDGALVVTFNGTPVMKVNKRVMAPGEMEQIRLKKRKLEEYPGLKEIRIAVEPADSLRA